MKSGEFNDKTRQSLASNWRIWSTVLVHNHQHIHHDFCNHSHDLSVFSIAGELDRPSDPSMQPRDRTEHKVRRLTYVLLLVASFSAIELAISRYSHSTALLADAGHLFTDCFALSLALFGAWLAQKTKFVGQRVEIAIALFNSLSLLIIGGGIAMKAILQLQAPAPDILSLPMTITAVIGLAVNSINIFLLHDRSHDDLNLKGVFLHIIADALSSLGVLVAALVVWKVHWLWADGAIGLLIAVSIVGSALPLVKQSFSQLASLLEV
ncbi:cation diffusion facilitator family transporter [Pseudanabaena sp. PCC 6802]|uniref:cation diffusion facilitator family transporter n=1 Tax=Pseudanabaena sp. PCC 6802 TaxID=118173 RepID=UPI000344909C|nr:cation diffusion facilitator family transporter [Pseudanabaena sp. PCC 6802]